MNYLTAIESRLSQQQPSRPSPAKRRARQLNVINYEIFVRVKDRQRTNKRGASNTGVANAPLPYPNNPNPRSTDVMEVPSLPERPNEDMREIKRELARQMYGRTQVTPQEDSRLHTLAKDQITANKDAYKDAVTARNEAIKTNNEAFATAEKLKTDNRLSAAQERANELAARTVKNQEEGTGRYIAYNEEEYPEDELPPSRHTT
jgi:hypothetical protein